METGGENVNIGNPGNLRRDAREDTEPKVTNAGHLRPQVGKADELFDDSVEMRDLSGMNREPIEGQVRADNPPAARPGTQAQEICDMHSPTVRDPLVVMVGERTHHREPFSGESGTHPVAVGIGAVTGGMAVGAATGLMAGSVAGPLGAAFGTAAGAVIGAFAGGYAGKGIGEAVNPTTEDHYWRAAYRSRPYVVKGSRYEEYEPAYQHGIAMRQRLMDQSWEEAEVVIRTGWEGMEYAIVMGWERARPAVRDAWDRLTPGPVESPVSDEEKERDE